MNSKGFASIAKEILYISKTMKKRRKAKDGIKRKLLSNTLYIEY